jgi:hypothetical protein
MSDQTKPQIKTLTLEAQMGGWIPDLWGVPGAALQGQPNQYTLGPGISLLRKEKLGHIAPAEIFNVGGITDGSSFFNSLPRAIAVDVTQSPNNYWYILGGLGGTAPGVVKASATGTTSRRDITATSGNNFTTLPGTGFWGEDIIFYTGSQSSAATPGIFYSWNDSGNGAVGYYNINTASFVSDNFFSGSDGGSYFAGSGINPVKGVPHRFCEGPNKILYMTNGQYVLSYDGNVAGNGNGTYTNKALNCGFGWICVDIVKYQNFIAILCIKNGTSFNSFTAQSECKVLLWDGTNAGANATPNFSYDVQDFYATALFNSDFLYCFSQGRNNTTKIKYLPIAYGVSKFQTLYENSTTSIGNAPDPRSIALYNGNLVWWGTSPNTASVLSCYIPGVGYHEPFFADDGSVTSTTVGMLSNNQSNKLYIGMKAGTTYEVQYLDGTGGYEKNVSFRTGLIELPYKSTIRRINIYFSQFSSNASVVASLVRDYNSGASLPGGANDLLNYTITTTTKPELVNALQTSIIQTITDVSSFYLNFYFNHAAVSNTAAIIRKVEVEYELTAKP